MSTNSFHTVQMHNLLERLKAGDRTAQNELVKKVSVRLERLARRMIKSFPAVARWAETEDVLQNALLRLLRALESVTPAHTRDFFNLAAVQIRRELIDMVRQLTGVHGLDANLVSRPGEGSSMHPMAAEVPSSPEEWTVLHEAVVFSLIYYHDWSQPQVAALLDVSDRTVRRIWQAALLRLHTVAKKWMLQE